MKSSLLVAPLVLLLSACATTQTTGYAPTEEGASLAIAAAETSAAEAAAVGYQWRDTAQILDSAREAAKAKEYDKAIALAERAEHQGMNALHQYEVQQGAAARF